MESPLQNGETRFDSTDLPTIQQYFLIDHLRRLGGYLFILELENHSMPALTCPKGDLPVAINLPDETVITWPRKIAGMIRISKRATYAGGNFWRLGRKGAGQGGVF
jgi:hypothetical protein